MGYYNFRLLKILNWEELVLELYKQGNSFVKLMGASILVNRLEKGPFYQQMWWLIERGVVVIK